MKKILALGLIIALALVVGAAAAEPFGIDVSQVGATGTVTFANAVQPTYIALSSVLPAGYTAAVSRVHNDSAVSLTNIVGNSGVFITSGIWMMPGDALRITGITNASIEIQGNQ